MKTLAQSKVLLHLYSILIVVLLLNFPAFASTVITGKVVGVSDGDTITVLQKKHQYKIRLYGVDCPESGQAFGNKAKQFTANMVFGKDVVVNVYDTDRYLRSVGVVRIGGATLNEALLKNGLAWYYEKYCKESFCPEWEKLQQQAQDEENGQWADKKQVPPWDWRKDKREGTQKRGIAWDFAEEAPTVKIHGNVKSRVFHSPSCPQYNCQNCTENFRSMSEAVKAGYRQHEQCVKG